MCVRACVCEKKRESKNRAQSMMCGCHGRRDEKKKVSMSYIIKSRLVKSHIVSNAFRSFSSGMSLLTGPIADFQTCSRLPSVHTQSSGHSHDKR